MFVQWCIKGVRGRDVTSGESSGIVDSEAHDMLDLGQGILCNWWRNAGTITPAGVRDKLTSANLDRHIHDYDNFCDETPFISLTAGSVERVTALRLNRIREAQDVALRFATDWGRHVGYLFYCWVVVGLKPAAEVQGVAEEVRELHTYTSYSDFQLEGEITAKINIPSNQIQRCERWEPHPRLSGHLVLSAGWPYDNPSFSPPDSVSNVRTLL